MTTLALAVRSPRSRAIGVVLVAIALALSAQIALPMPGTQVPLSLQPFVVIVAGLLIGPLDAAAAMVLYLAAGAAGAPVFAPMGPPGLARLLGPTGGYLLAYPVAAAVAGALGAGRERFAARLAAAIAGMLVLYVGGLSQLTIITGSLTAAAVQGVLPFVAADLLKAIVAAAVSGRRSGTTS